MKRAFILVLVLLAVAGIMAAQTTAPKPAAPAPAQAPSAPAQAAPGQAAAPTAAPATGRRPVQAKTPEEFQAFQQATTITSAADIETAANNFATKFPDSELRVLLWRKAMYSYQDANNAEKAIEMGRKMLAIDSNNPEALIMVATFLSERTRETDLDRDERLTEAVKDANRAFETIDTDIMLPPNATPEQATGMKNQLRGLAYSTLGTIEITRKNYPAAESNLRQALNLYPGDAVAWLRLAFALDKQNKYADAIAPTDKCIQAAANQPQVANLCKAERQRLDKLVSAAPAPATTPAATPAPKPATPPPAPPK